MAKPYQRTPSDIALHIVGSIVSRIYKLLFSGLDERAYQRNRRRFIGDVQLSFAELFAKHPGQIHPEKGRNLPRAFDYVSIDVEFSELVFRLVSGRGELAVYVAPSTDSTDMQDLGTLCKDYGVVAGYSSMPGYLDHTARYIQNHWDELVQLYTTNNPAVIGLKRTRLSTQLSQGAF
jgi:hypothetical protein